MNEQYRIYSDAHKPAETFKYRLVEVIDNETRRLVATFEATAKDAQAIQDLLSKLEK